MIAGTGDDKTDIVIIADAYDRAAIYGRDRNITSNANQDAWGGFDNRSADFPGFIGQLGNPEAPLGFRLIPKLFFSGNSPPPHSAPNVSTSPYYTNNVPYPDGNFALYNSAAVTASIPAADRQSFYGSFTRDICDKYLTVFADFKYTRSFFDAAGAATGFPRIHSSNRTVMPLVLSGISVPIANPFNPFTVADTTLPDGTPVTTGVHFSGINDTGGATSKTTFRDILFDAGLRGQMGEFGDYFKNWNWELGFRYSRNDEETLTGGVVSETGLREALLDTDPATAFNPFLGFRGRNTEAAISRVYVTLHNTGQFELPLAYFHLNGDLFNLPAGPVSFAAGLEYRGERWRNNPDSENASFDAIGTANFQASKVNRDVWATYQEVRIPVTSPAWNCQEHTVSSSTSPSAKNGIARIHLRLLLVLRFCLRNTPSLMRRSRNFPFAGSRLTPSGLARSPYVALTAKRFMRRHYPTLRRPGRRFSSPHLLAFTIQRG